MNIMQLLRLNSSQAGFFVTRSARLPGRGNIYDVKRPIHSKCCDWLRATGSWEIFGYSVVREYVLVQGRALVMRNRCRTGANP